MTRSLIGAAPAEAFRISLIGASIIREEDEAFDLIQGITGLNHPSLVNACKLAGYDVIYRAGMAGYRPGRRSGQLRQRPEHHCPGLMCPVGDAQR
ncbi:hypothetical protein QFZ21_001054 [Microbacterium sp. W4I20]|nr:hypothetical protein [Microbacterium sp. W4I20]